MNTVDKHPAVRKVLRRYNTVIEPFATTSDKEQPKCGVIAPRERNPNRLLTFRSVDTDIYELSPIPDLVAGLRPGISDLTDLPCKIDTENKLRLNENLKYKLSWKEIETSNFKKA